ncbi:molybdenum cofactor guanylyltransferase [Virgibacillus byunsanensis]|uniref:Probable molybdenum cofactor guanylyltransferase n=1 Tax=Virgibacillus byunsanensis TaxID=570945 RepID=A0ABW3LSP9_9BACI
MHVCGVVLSGGKSSRMGKNKSLLTLQGKPVIERISSELQTCSSEVVVITNEPSLYSFLSLSLIKDRYLNKGPLAGIESALYHVEADVYVFAACDMPFASEKVYGCLLNYMKGYDAVVPIYNNRIHPLSGIYRRSALPFVQESLDKDELKVKQFLDKIRVKYVNDYSTIPKEIVTKHFFNMNFPEQYEEAKGLSHE